jgi:hypothetical protein
MGRPICDLRRHLRGLILLMLVPVAFAQQPHQHGVVALNIAIDQRVLFIEFITPLHDVAGFEHWPPEDEAEQAAVDRAVRVMSDSRSVFSMPAAAKCKLKEVDANLPGDNPSSDDDFAAEPTAPDPEGEVHADLTILYRFKCKAPDNLAQIRVHLFRLFPKLRSIQANLITDTEQTFQELSFAEPMVFIAR